jgi:DNA polymerase III subunit beta
MELKIPVQELTKALYRCQGIVERKTTMPVLSNVLLRADRTTGLTISAFDTEIGLTSEHRCEVLKDGVAALPARHLYDIVRSLGESDVLLKAHGAQVELRSGAARFRVVSSPAEDFPALPGAGDAKLVEIAADLLAEMIERTSFAISLDETRYNLGGIYLEQPEGTNLKMVATDGHRLALIERELAGNLHLTQGVIVPRKGLLELRRLLAEEEGGACHLGFTKGSMVFRRDGVQMVMRLLDGQFPDYRQVIPKEGSRVVKMNRQKLLESLKRVSLLSTDKSYGVRLELAPDKVTLSSQNPDLGEAQEEVDAAVTGGDLKIGFNARYLLDVLSVLSCDEIQLGLSDELSPGVIRPVGEAGYLAVVMPMRI